MKNASTKPELEEEDTEGLIGRSEEEWTKAKNTNTALDERRGQRI